MRYPNMKQIIAFVFACLLGFSTSCGGRSSQHTPLTTNAVQSPIGTTETNMLGLGSEELDIPQELQAAVYEMSAQYNRRVPYHLIREASDLLHRRAFTYFAFANSPDIIRTSLQIEVFGPCTAPTDLQMTKAALDLGGHVESAHTFSGRGFYGIGFPSPKSVNELAHSADALLTALPTTVKCVEPTVMVRPADSSTDPFDVMDSDPLYTGEIDARLNWATTKVSAGEVWDSGIDGHGISVAILDDGAYQQHQDFIDNTPPETTFFNIGPYGFQVNWGPGNSDNPFVTAGEIDEGANDHLRNHGSMAAGAIGAKRNTLGITGIAYGAKIVPFKLALVASGEDGWGFHSTSIIEALGQLQVLFESNNETIVDLREDLNLRVISISWSSPTPVAAINSAIEELCNSYGVLTVAPYHDNLQEGIYPVKAYPGSEPYVLGVEEVDYADRFILISGQGWDLNDDPVPDAIDGFGPIAGPSSDVILPNIVGPASYETTGGVSFATPAVAAVAALDYLAHPGSTADAVRTRLIDNARPNRRWNLGYSPTVNCSYLVDEMKVTLNHPNSTMFVTESSIGETHAVIGANLIDATLNRYSLQTRILDDLAIHPPPLTQPGWRSVTISNPAPPSPQLEFLCGFTKVYENEGVGAVAISTRYQLAGHWYRNLLIAIETTSPGGIGWQTPIKVAQIQEDLPNSLAVLDVAGFDATGNDGYASSGAALIRNGAGAYEVVGWGGVGSMVVNGTGQQLLAAPQPTFAGFGKLIALRYLEQSTLIPRVLLWKSGGSAWVADSSLATTFQANDLVSLGIIHHEVGVGWFRASSGGLTAEVSLGDNTSNIVHIVPALQSPVEQISMVGNSDGKVYFGVVADLGGSHVTRILYGIRSKWPEHDLDADTNGTHAYLKAIETLAVIPYSSGSFTYGLGVDYRAWPYGYDWTGDRLSVMYKSSANDSTYALESLDYN